VGGGVGGIVGRARVEWVRRVVRRIITRTRLRIMVVGGGSRLLIIVCWLSCVDDRNMYWCGYDSV